ncbi:hypothetical protein A2U01_0071776, partial [Trifolium medium]|nr:hypothetical protein [Trifolium medium]
MTRSLEEHHRTLEKFRAREKEQEPKLGFEESSESKARNQGKTK